MNPVMFIPFVLIQPILAAITLAAYSMGIIPPVTNLAPWTMPTGLGRSLTVTAVSPHFGGAVQPGVGAGLPAVRGDVQQSAGRY
jgi:hypothetical protein